MTLGIKIGSEGKFEVYQFEHWGSLIEKWIGVSQNVIYVMFGK